MAVAAGLPGGRHNRSISAVVRYSRVRTEEFKWLVPTGRPCGFPPHFGCGSTQLENYRTIVTFANFGMTFYLRDLSPRGRDQRFFDLGDGIVTGLIDVEMRKVGNLVGRDDAIEDRGPVRCKGLGNRAAQLTRKLCLESVAATGAGQYGKIRIREFDRLPESRETHTLRLVDHEFQTGIIVDDHFHWQLVVHR